RFVANAAKEFRVTVHAHARVAELALVRAFDTTAELRGHRLLAVADTEHRDVHRKYRGRCARRFLDRYRFWSAGQNYASRLEATDFLFGRIVRVNFAIDAELAHTPCDQLHVLRT